MTCQRIQLALRKEERIGTAIQTPLFLPRAQCPSFPASVSPVRQLLRRRSARAEAADASTAMDLLSIIGSSDDRFHLPTLPSDRSCCMYLHATI